jgi:hypothetical protein
MRGTEQKWSGRAGGTTNGGGRSSLGGCSQIFYKDYFEVYKMAASKDGGC